MVSSQNLAQLNNEHNTREFFKHKAAENKCVKKISGAGVIVDSTPFQVK